MSKPLIYIIAGEASGDILGAGLMKALKEELHGEVTFIGIGGERMGAQGLFSLFPMQEISLMGFAEILPHIFHLKKRIKETVQDIIEKKPAMLVTIDSPGFTFRVASEVRKALGKEIRMVHYVAPTVWAYKPERAAKTAALFDHLMVILPFEPPYFIKHGLATTFVGHPVLELWKDKGDGPRFRKNFGLKPIDRPVILILPGSREGEIRRHMPVIAETLKLLQASVPGLLPMFYVSRALEGLVLDLCNQSQIKAFINSVPEFKKDIFACADVALVKSGTVTLEVAAAGVPMVMFYKVNKVTAWIVKRLIKISQVNLLNIISGKSIIPEFIQDACTPQALSHAILPLLKDKNLRQQQVAEASTTLNALRLPFGESPNSKAAKSVVGLLNSSVSN